ncbi:MAG: tRNA pseudouridine(55) synthase TruB [Burkholderiales bacterium]
MVAETVDGILLLDKPLGITSNAALQVAKRLLGARKAGHAGTLDPRATGLLPICFGEATKFAGILLDAQKTYTAEVRLGVTTTTGDAEGDVIDRRPVEVVGDRLHAVLTSFVGGYDQLPPAYSALKYHGRPYYEYARSGGTVPRVRRHVAIPDLTLDSREGDLVRFTVTCSKGTYIRSLAQDIGDRLGCGAHLSGLRRLASGPFQLANACTLSDLAEATIDWRRAKLLAADSPLSTLAEVVISLEETMRLRNGQRIAAVPGTPVGLVRIYAFTRQFIGLGEITRDTQLIPRRLVAAADLDHGSQGANL